MTAEITSLAIDHEVASPSVNDEIKTMTSRREIDDVVCVCEA